MEKDLLEILNDYLERLRDDRRVSLEGIGYGFDGEINKNLEDIRLLEEKVLRVIEHIERQANQKPLIENNGFWSAAFKYRLKQIGL